MKILRKIGEIRKILDGNIKNRKKNLANEFELEYLKQKQIAKTNYS